MASIYEVGPGDYVKVGSGEFKRIARIESVPSPYNPGKYKRWTVVTTDGQRVSMLDARSYHKMAEVE